MRGSTGIFRETETSDKTIAFKEMVNPDRAQFKNLPGNQRAIGMYLDRSVGRYVIVISGNFPWPRKARVKWHFRIRIKINVQPI